MAATVNIVELLNLVGHIAGVVLYAMLLAMVVRAGRTPGPASRFDPLVLVTAVVGLVWNLCALPAYELPKMGIEGPFPYLVAVGFGAVGLLPAVVVHSVLRGERHAVRGWLKQAVAAVAYSVSAIAAVLNLYAARTEETVPAALGMRLLTVTFIALVVPLAAVTRGQPGARRALWATALVGFAVSALHLSQMHQGEAPWPLELIGHHASLPLAVAILYQDYPFALADLFLKRALALLAIAAITIAGIAAFGLQSATFAQFVQVDPKQVSILATLWVATALLYPFVRRGTAWFVDTIVLHRPNYVSLRTTIARTVQTCDDVPALLTDVCTLLAPAFSAQCVTWRESRSLGREEALGPVVIGGSDVSAVVRNTAMESLPAPVAALVTVPTTDAPEFVLAIGQLTGGRRLLSDDLSTLEAIAIVIARRIDAIRITKERYERETREQEIGKLATEAELRALRAQVNPHFLFNALTTIGYLIQTAPPRALQTLLRLTALLRAVLRSEGEFTTLGRELELIEAYLDIERARFEARLRVTLDVPNEVRNLRIPALVLQPLVENAVKHGIAQKTAGGDVLIRARIEQVDAHTQQLSLVVHDSGAGASPAQLERGRDAGVGLRNIERRLASQYGDRASLSIRTTLGEGAIVEIRMPVEIGVAHDSAEGQKVAL